MKTKLLEINNRLEDFGDRRNMLELERDPLFNVFDAAYTDISYLLALVLRQERALKTALEYLYQSTVNNISEDFLNETLSEVDQILYEGDEK